MADKIPEKPKEIYKPSQPMQPSYYPKGNQYQKTPEKTFQNFMEQMEQGDHRSTPTQQTTKETPRPVQSHDERREGTKDEQYKKLKDRDVERDRKVGSDSREGDGNRAKVAEKKVVGRQSMSERNRQGQDKGGGGKGFGQGRDAQRGPVGILSAKMASGTKKGVAASKELAPFAALMAEKAGTAGKAGEIPRTMSKQMIDQIVQYVRLMTRVDGEKEMELTLHEKIFKGLRLRVTLVKGVVSATFLTSSSEVQKFFEAQKKQIHEALSEKGIDINTLTVTRS